MPFCQHYRFPVRKLSVDSVDFVLVAGKYLDRAITFLTVGNKQNSPASFIEKYQPRVPVTPKFVSELATAEFSHFFVLNTGRQAPAGPGGFTAVSR